MLDRSSIGMMEATALQMWWSSSNGGRNFFVSCSQCQHHCSFIHTAVSTEISLLVSCSFNPNTMQQLSSTQRNNIHFMIHDTRNTVLFTHDMSESPTQHQRVQCWKIWVSVQLLHKKMQQCSKGSPQLWYTSIITQTTSRIIHTSYTWKMFVEFPLNLQHTKLGHKLGFVQSNS